MGSQRFGGPSGDRITELASWGYEAGGWIAFEDVLRRRAAAWGSVRGSPRRFRHREGFDLRSEGRPPTLETMPIPAFDEHGSLPEGIHDCTLAEAEARFGSFQGSDRRRQLWSRFKEFFQEAKASGLVEAILLDCSFVTATSA